VKERFICYLNKNNRFMCFTSYWLSCCVKRIAGRAKELRFQMNLNLKWIKNFVYQRLIGLE
jgi:hypothetical protein